jgi:hypothetical protein
MFPTLSQRSNEKSTEIFEARKREVATPYGISFRDPQQDVSKHASKIQCLSTHASVYKGEKEEQYEAKGNLNTKDAASKALFAFSRSMYGAGKSSRKQKYISCRGCPVFWKWRKLIDKIPV